MKYDYLIVGSGLFGAAFARMATDRGCKCLVIEKRNHLGGNVYCQEINGINVHMYGPHIFHTSSKKVWDFVNRFAEFNHYVHCPLARYGQKLYNLPFNMNTFYQMWGVLTPESAKRKIEEQKQLMNDKIGTSSRNLEEQAINLVGYDIYERLIKGYTEKQWGRACSELPPFIIRRIPVRYSYDNNYFNDFYQGIPVGGYNKLINGLLEGIEVHTNTDYFECYAKIWRSLANCLVYTGKIDDYFDCCFGSLNYRTMRFETEILNVSNYQGVSQMNYTALDVPYTRIVEHKHFEYFGEDVYSNPNTIITKEYSEEFGPGKEAYYPINDSDNNEKYLKYKKMAEKEVGVIFGGRLAEYKYYDMDKILEKVMDFWK